VGVDRQDRDGRERQMQENFRFFGAPHVAVISSPHSLGVYGAVDCDGYVARLLTVAQSLGLRIIAQAAIAMHTDSARVPADPRGLGRRLRRLFRVRRSGAPGERLPHRPG